ncbi:MULTISPECIES: GNAT family N-acetyltransferase [unclassified Pseudofrankia]|uniref:GNAT family N-acetyltransferase n=1 Tax=unclassified Pseudofrankia TaxID=2994372 RepID=UPI0008DAA2B6|nr:MULTISPECIES: GNAT family N-acetyltransferase [unclassified Pseudofrankia]MDT3444418.1 GNAT family N-acetyltransferase [Pseudofrankia sp. BMG5.37]OHV56457.1 acetyltransferase [Pseudofrankia sp. BMG5.36]
MKVTSLGYRTDLMVRRLTGSLITEHASHLVVRTPANPGFWWGNFILVDGPARRGDADRWAATFADAFPRAAHLALGVDSGDGDAGDESELTRLGVTVEVNSVLTATRLVPPTRPVTGAAIRPLVGDDDWAQAAQLRAVCHDDEEPSAEERLFIARAVTEERRLCEAGGGIWFGAFVDGRLRSGAGLVGDGGELARYQNVETHPDFRRGGLASAVVHGLGQWGVRELGARTLVIVADPDDQAIRVYRALGFTDTEHQVQLQRAPGQ